MDSLPSTLPNPGRLPPPHSKEKMGTVACARRTSPSWHRAYWAREAVHHGRRILRNLSESTAHARSLSPPTFFSLARTLKKHNAQDPVGAPRKKKRLSREECERGAQWYGRSSPDGVAGAHADPLGDGPVLLLLLAQNLLSLERLLGRLWGRKGWSGDVVTK